MTILKVNSDFLFNLISCAEADIMDEKFFQEEIVKLNPEIDVKELREIACMDEELDEDDDNVVKFPSGDAWDNLFGALPK